MLLLRGWLAYKIVEEILTRVNPSGVWLKLKGKM